MQDGTIEKAYEAHRQQLLKTVRGYQAPPWSLLCLEHRLAWVAAFASAGVLPKSETPVLDAAGDAKHSKQIEEETSYAADLNANERMLLSKIPQLEFAAKTSTLADGLKAVMYRLTTTSSLVVYGKTSLLWHCGNKYEICGERLIEDTQLQGVAVNHVASWLALYNHKAGVDSPSAKPTGQNALDSLDCEQIAKIGPRLMAEVLSFLNDSESVRLGLWYANKVATIGEIRPNSVRLDYPTRQRGAVFCEVGAASYHVSGGYEFRKETHSLHHAAVALADDLDLK